MNNNHKPMLDVLQGQTPERIPVWLMRQAGRYLPEYRSLRATAGSFLTMALTPELATEITLQPLRRFDIDAAILFADILLVPMALGAHLEFREGEGPILQKTTNITDIEKLFYNPEKVSSVFEAVRRVKAALPDKKALIGFCGAPWTVACYMIDGDSKTNFSIAKSWVQEQPHLLQQLIEILIDASEKYLSSQIEAGAEIVQIFDSWGGLLSGNDFAKYVIAPTRELVSRLKHKYPHIPIIGFPREAGSDYTPYIRETGVDAMSIDQSVDIESAKHELQIFKPLQGNLSPDLLVQGGEVMTKQLEKIITTFGKKHIVNLGHGVVPQTPPEHVAQMVDFVHGFSV